jgi:hypothetical protein
MQCVLKQQHRGHACRPLSLLACSWYRACTGTDKEEDQLADQHPARSQNLPHGGAKYEYHHDSLPVQ